MAKTQFNRRNFLQTSAIGASALSLSAASAARVYGANEKINIAFLGVGGRCQQHVDVILQMQKENKNVVPFAVC
ncbi:twin-arginine translocation signal domain-containing protein, partial [bacterium]|nr:twin-arginine translocation signal domain-containing protein [bacterium]